MVRLTALVFTAIALGSLGVADVRAWAERRRLLDLPNDRSSHTRPTARGGGLPIVLVTLLGLLLFPWSSPDSPGWVNVLAFGLLAVTIAGVSFADDIRTIRTGPRLLVHAVCALGLLLQFGYWHTVTLPAVGAIPLGPLGAIAAFLWVVGFLNLYNFMDGIDGIAGGQAVVAGLGWIALGAMTGTELPMVLGILLGGASLGFLFHNWSPARVFMGDVGSTFLGFSFAALAVITAPIDPRLPLVGAAFVWPFLFDGSFTIGRRLLNRENILKAHRSHLYQRLTIAGRSHQFVSLLYIGCAALTSGSALLWFADFPFAGPWLIICLCLVPLLLWWITVEQESAVQAPARAGSVTVTASPVLQHDRISTPLVRPSPSGTFLIKQFLARLLLVYLSLIAAFTIRFVLLYLEGKVEHPDAYAVFLNFSIQAIYNSVIRMLAAGLLLFYVHEQLLGRFLPLPRLYRGVIALTGFFGLMTGLSATVRSGVTFPRQTWLLAWAISLVAYAGLQVSRALSQQAKERIIYSRIYHYAIDIAVIGFSCALAYMLRFDGLPPADFQRQFWVVLPYLVLLYLGMNLALGVYAFVWRFTSLREAIVLGLAVGSSGLVALLVRIILLNERPAVRIPFGVLIATPILCYGGFLGARILRRLQHGYAAQRRQVSSPGAPGSRRVLLVGAGNAGVQLVHELGSRPEFKFVGFLDDDPEKRARVIAGVRVLGNTKEAVAIAKAKQAKEVILCMPTAPRSVIRRIVTECQRAHLRTLSVPSIAEIVAGKVRVGQLRPVRMEDLLGRDSIEYQPDEELMAKFRGRRVMVTGAAGSIGSELARQLRYFEPEELILLDKDESGLFEIAMELREEYDGAVREIIADIRNLGRMGRVFSRLKPEVIFHAAAYKHVPMMESHPSEAILNNTIGTRNLVQLAGLCRVDSFVLISTDKAVNPTNIMGASKRLAEMVVQQAACKDCASFCCVRFGNVLGSRASVVPIFQRRISQGKNLQVTHPDIKRFFMTIPEAVQLVIQAGSLGKEGEIFVLDMGNPVKIVDLAKDLIEQSGLVLGQDIDIEFTGLRPGEKLYEELLISEENGVRDTRYPKIFSASAVPGAFSDLDCVLEGLEKAAIEEDTQTIYKILSSINIGYQGKVRPITAAQG
jgi:FlaA1/EpsC-like NDP-sugar epimerase/UDP-N-acetylmuramyl pentapeptide phosphotransferase/UDP-N-acetylglucosamine-1-phosphate transferase